MTDRSMIADRVKEFLAGIPPHVAVLAAAKTRSVSEIRAAINGGIRIIGYNYVQEAAASLEALGRSRRAIEPEERATFSNELTGPLEPSQFEAHMIGHLQRNKVKSAVRLFDTIQTVDSLRLAEAIDRECRKLGRVMPILVEINSAREPQKSGVFPEETADLIRGIAGLPSVRVDGLMTMGPLAEDPEEIRPYFGEAKRLFDEIDALRIPNVSMNVLSMGMSGSYGVAIEAGATMVRLGTVLFGPRGSQA
jgi:pyridoxal phosphate enzyme (YggS family)